MTVGERINKRRKEIGLSAEKIADMLGVSRSTVYRYENGDIDKLPVDALDPLARVLQTTPAYLMGWDVVSDAAAGIESLGEPYAPTHRIPILGYISAGLPLYAAQHIEGYTYTTLNGGNEYFALRVKGDSMTAARIFEGDTLIVRRQSDVDNGEIAVVLVNGDNATVKRFYRSGGMVTLVPQSLNQDHAPQMYSLKDTNVTVLGKVVRVEFNT